MDAFARFLSVLALPSALLPVLARGAFAQSDPILEVHAPSLTTYQATASSPKNDVRPLAVQRGVGLDGRMRAGSLHGLAIAGNPYESVWSGESMEGVVLGSGTHTIQDVDIALPAQVQWLIGRTYSARQQDSGGTHRDSNGLMGRNWFQNSQPELVFYNDNDDELDLIYLVYGADRYLEFKRFNDASGSFRATNGGAGVLVFAAGASTEPDTYALTCMDGTVVTFFGFDGDSGVAAGQIWKITDTASNVAYVGNASTGSTAISSGFDGSGRITQAWDSADRRYTYTYGSVGGSTRLTQVKAETKGGGTWASPTGLVERAKVDYGYYTADGDSFGDQFGLKLVTITTPLTDSGVSHTKKKHYRYWEGAFNASTNPGHPHGLKLIVDFEGGRNYDWTLNGAIDDDYLAATHDNLKPYAAAYFEYDSSHRISKVWMNGECGCSGGIDGEYAFEYETNGGYSNSSGYTTTWMARTIIAQPDGSYITQYFDEVHQPLSRVLTDADPDNTGPDPSKWATRVTRDSAGCVVEISTPANITAYTHSTASFTASSSVGLVNVYGRESSGATTGYLLDQFWKAGTSGTAYLDGSQTYGTGSKATGDTYVIRSLIASDREYPVAITSGTSGSNVTSYATTFYSSSLAIEKVVTTLPAVSTGNNGSNSSNTRSQHWSQDQNADFEKSEDGHITYRAYVNGQVVKTIEDADTSLTGSGQDFDGVTIPSGFTSTGTGLHWKTTYAFDSQGRLEMTTLPGTRNKKSYFTKLADSRLVTLEYNDFETSPSTKFFGPVHYTVSNLAGRAEFGATVALSGNESTVALTGHLDESDSDPIVACDLGTIAQLSTRHYSKSGTRLETSRLYHVVPGSGAGSDGSNYDATTHAYDPMGRKWRSKAPHGTINRTVYDIRGNSIESWIGTNDSNFSGGESSGTDNMVKTDATVFDGGSAGGNGWATQRIAFVEGSTTGQRITTFSLDLRGNVLLVSPPEAPYAFNKYDNLRRRVATGLFSSTGSITVGSDDPTTETANRLALSQTFFDELGRVWKSQRHKIDASDGSDDDNLQRLTWYDAEGQVVKVDGEQLVKTEYDGLHRVIRTWILAEDDDSSYSDALGILSDIVLEEHHSSYDPTTGDRQLSAVILRHPTDKSTGESTGALDTNADGNRLILTAGNIKGRLQIVGHWYDRFGRAIDTARLGTNNDATYDRTAASSAPARSDTVLRRTSVYNTDGTLREIEDERGKITRYERDATGRQTKTTANYGDGVPSGDDSDQTIVRAYTDGLMVTLTADLPSGQTDQVTTYTYGTTKGASAGDSKIATGHLLKQVAYPDSTGSSDTVKHAYNAQGEEIWKSDQGGNVFEMVYSDTGRLLHRRVTTLGSGFDGAVRRISTSFDSLGRRERVGQYDSATAGSGSIVDEVKFSYDGWGEIARFEQDRNSAVGAGGSIDDYEVSYAYEKATGGRNTIRKTAQTLPSGNVITLIYNGSGGDHDDSASRVTQIRDDAVRLASYWYLGAGRVVGTRYSEPSVMRHQWTASTGVTSTYPDLDRFGRIVRDRWTKDLATDIDFYSVDRVWDRAGNITLAEDNVHSGFDVSYSIDGLNRLTRSQEGTWNGSSIASETRDQEWTLSHLGNWEFEKLDLNGDGDWNDAGEHQDDRTHNDANETLARDIDDNGTNNYSLGYDSTGDLTDDGVNYTYEWDCFYRLRRIQNRTNAALVAEYSYNGLGFEIGEHVDVDMDGDVDGADPWYYSVYDVSWRHVATMRGNDTSPKEEFVHHCAGGSGRGLGSYIDLVVLRDMDISSQWNAPSDGTLERRHYYCQNWHADVSVILDSTSGIQEWSKYLSYGIPFGLPAGDTDSDGDCDGTDVAQVQSWIGSSAYDTRGDVDLDGDVDTSDKSAQLALFQGITTGYYKASAFLHRKGLAGMRISRVQEDLYHARNRVLASNLGSWIARDPYGYVDSISLLQFAGSNPARYLDPFGSYIMEPDDTAATGGQESKPAASQPTHEKGDCKGKFKDAKNKPQKGGGPWFTPCPNGECPTYLDVDLKLAGDSAAWDAYWDCIIPCMSKKSPKFRELMIDLSDGFGKHDKPVNISHVKYELPEHNGNKDPEGITTLNYDPDSPQQQNIGIEFENDGINAEIIAHEFGHVFAYDQMIDEWESKPHGPGEAPLDPGEGPANAWQAAVGDVSSCTGECHGMKPTNEKSKSGSAKPSGDKKRK